MTKQTENRPGNITRSPSSTHDNSIHALTSEIEALGDRDVFQELMHKGAESLEKNSKVAMIALLAIVLVGIGWVGYGWLQERTQKSAQEAFYTIEKRVTEKKESFEKAKAASLGAAVGKKPETPPTESKALAPTGDLEKDFGGLIGELETFAKERQSTSAGLQAALLAADLRIEYKQGDKALVLLKSARESSAASTVLGGLVRMAEANALAAAEKCSDALSLWQSVLDQKSSAFLHGEASLRAGVCLETMGQKDRAIEMYKKAAADGERSSSAQSAKSLLRRLELGT